MDKKKYINIKNLTLLIIIIKYNINRNLKY